MMLTMSRKMHLRLHSKTTLRKNIYLQSIKLGFNKYKFGNFCDVSESASVSMADCLQVAHM